MVLDRFFSDREVVGDLLVAHALGDEFENLGLSVAEHVELGVVGLVVVLDTAEVVEDFGRDLGSQLRLISKNIVHIRGGLLI